MDHSISFNEICSANLAQGHSSIQCVQPPEPKLEPDNDNHYNAMLSTTGFLERTGNPGPQVQLNDQGNYDGAIICLRPNQN